MIFFPSVFPVKSYRARQLEVFKSLNLLKKYKPELHNYRFIPNDLKNIRPYDSFKEFFVEILTTPLRFITSVYQAILAFGNMAWNFLTLPFYLLTLQWQEFKEHLLAAVNYGGEMIYHLAWCILEPFVSLFTVLLAMATTVLNIEGHIHFLSRKYTDFKLYGLFQRPIIEQYLVYEDDGKKTFHGSTPWPEKNSTKNISLAFGMFKYDHRKVHPEPVLKKDEDGDWVPVKEGSWQHINLDYSVMQTVVKQVKIQKVPLVPIQHNHIEDWVFADEKDEYESSSYRIMRESFATEDRPAKAVIGLWPDETFPLGSRYYINHPYKTKILPHRAMSLYKDRCEITGEERILEAYEEGLTNQEMPEEMHRMIRSVC